MYTFFFYSVKSSFLVRRMNLGDLKARLISTFTAQLITLVSTVIDTITGLALRNEFLIHTLKGVIC